MPLPIETERLVLRAYRPDGVERIHALVYGAPAVRTWTGGPSTLDETGVIIARYIEAQARDGYAYWAVVKRGSDAIVGEAGLKPLDDVGPEVEIGYAFGQPWWGRGYGTEVARALLHEAFQVLRLPRVFATACRENAGSLNVLRKLGFAPADGPETGDPTLLYHVLERPV